jgi:ribonuclease HI
LGLLKVFTDGASRGNPGRAGIGIVIYDENNFIITSHKEYIGISTNNQAEYTAIIRSLSLIKKLIKNNEITEVRFFSDSELMVNQLNLDYFTKEPELAVLNNKFQVIVRKLGINYSIHHIARSENKHADRLANLAIDQN